MQGQLRRYRFAVFAPVNGTRYGGPVIGRLSRSYLTWLGWCPRAAPGHGGRVVPPSLPEACRRLVGLLRRILEVGPLRCLGCGREMRMVAFIAQPRVIDRILTHLWTTQSGSLDGPPRQLYFRMVSCSSYSDPEVVRTTLRLRLTRCLVTIRNSNTFLTDSPSQRPACCGPTSHPSN